MRYVITALLSVFLGAGSAGAGTESIVTIGGIVKVLTSSTSCARENWGKNDENACRCCITKHRLKGDSPQSTLDYCSKKSKHCSDNVIQNIADKEKVRKDPVDPVEFTMAVRKSSIAIHEVQLNESYLRSKGATSGALNEETAVYFLKTAAENGLIEDYKEKLIKGDQCIEAESLSSGGAQTLQLFAVRLKKDACENASEARTIFILKEMKKATDEVFNLEKIRGNWELQKYLVENNPTTELQIALSHKNLLYKYQNQEHYMSLLPAAKGSSIGNYLEALLQIAETGTSEAIENEKIKVTNVSCAAGRATSNFNQDTMAPPGAIFGKAIQHGDFHMENVFVYIDSNGKATVYLIDNESMAASLDRKMSVARDLIRIYAHSSSRFLGRSSLYQKYKEKFPEGDWNNIFFEPFIRCYAKAYPPERLSEVKRELKKIFTTRGVFDLLKNQKSLYNMFEWSRVQGTLGKIIDDL